MRAAILTLLILAPAALANPCPRSAPTERFRVSQSCGYAGQSCPNGPVTFRIHPQATEPWPWIPFEPGYEIQPCDEVTWFFGDGAEQTVSGADRVTHDYPVPGNYVVGVKIANALGSVAFARVHELVVATSPSRLSFVTTGGFFPWFCERCIVVREDSGSVTIELERLLDLTRTISVEVFVNGTAYVVPTLPRYSQRFTFAPNETRKRFTLPIYDDRRYFGRRWYLLELRNPAGGVLTYESPGPTLLVIDDDAQQVLSIPAALSVVEGSSGLTHFSVPVTLSEPMYLDTGAYVSFKPGTATAHDYVWGSSAVHIPAGETSGVIVGSVRGDVLPESDETFLIELIPRSTLHDPAFGNTRLEVTIVDDDADARAIPAVSAVSLFAIGAGLVLVALASLHG